MEVPKKYQRLLAKRKITKREVAAILGVSESYLCRITEPLPKGPDRARREAASELAAARRKHRMKLAKQVAAGRLKLETAATRANCSLRTMYRYLERT